MKMSWMVVHCKMHDIKIWSPYGGLTPVEERGINLSGGQKQRIQLARTIYNDSYIYFLGDPSNVVDAHTRSHLFKVSIGNDFSFHSCIFQFNVHFVQSSNNLP